MRYLIRHDSGECVEIHANTKARLAALVKAECTDRGWLLADTEVIEIPERQARNGKHDN